MQSSCMALASILCGRMRKEANDITFVVVVTGLSIDHWYPKRARDIL